MFSTIEFSIGRYDYTVTKSYFIGILEVTIGENSIVGANALVTKDVEPNSIYVGAPAKKLRDLRY